MVHDENGRDTETVHQREFQRGRLRDDAIGAAALAGPGGKLEFQLTFALGTDIAAFGDAEQVLAIDVRGLSEDSQAGEERGNGRNHGLTHFSHSRC